MKKPPAFIVFFVSALIIVLLVAAFNFVFNPFGLGPAPRVVLPEAFFAKPAADLSQLKLLVDGKAAFGEIVSAIDAARSSIYIQTYIWKDDRTGRLLVERLKMAADREVTVTIRKDALGTVFELGDMLKGSPSPVFTRQGLKGYATIEVITDVLADTDHSKYYIFDGHTVIFGGMNIADEYHYRWHDYMVGIQSKRWTAAFEQKAIHGTPWPGEAPFFLAVNNRKATEIVTALIQTIERAARQVVIQHAYFSAGRVLKAVERAVERGVDVVVILPEKPDTHVYANRATINRLLASGDQKSPRIFLYPHMSHAKVIMTDGVIAAIGSANLTPRSMATSRELTLFVHAKEDAPFIKQLGSQLEADISQSQPVKQPYRLSLVESIMAIAGKYIW